MKLQIGKSVIFSYRRLPYRAWYAIAEFVDNSTDVANRKSNAAALKKQMKADGEKLEISIDFDKAARVVRIRDNSMGMNYEELEKSLVISQPPEETSGRSEFGMGMKTAAIWFADRLEIVTKKLGEKEEFRVKVDFRDFAAESDDELDVVRTLKPAELHYTQIELHGLVRAVGVSALQKLRKNLGSIYREDIRNDRIKLTVDSQEVVAPAGFNDDIFMKRTNGTPFAAKFENLEVNDKKVSGWIGVLETGKREDAGFTLLRHGRAVRGWGNSWRPEELFASGAGSNLNQRLVGELVMDEFAATHTKDGIDWDGDDEEALGVALKKIASEYQFLKEARKTKGNSEDSEQAALERAEAQARFKEQGATNTVGDAIRLLDTPKPDQAKLQNEVLLDAADHQEPFDVWDIGNGQFGKIFEVRLSPNDPYFESEVMANKDLRVVINQSHPAMALLTSAEARLTHYHHVFLDALAEWKCGQQHAPLDASSINLMKDQLFRAVAKAETEE
jgi:hypothetical protein